MLVISPCKAYPVVYNASQNEDVSIQDSLAFSARIPAGGNSWVINNLESNETVISDNGIHHWTNTEDVIRTYFYAKNTGFLNLGLVFKVPTETSTLKISVEGESREIKLSNTEYKEIPIGRFKISAKGYHFIEIQGVEKSTIYIGDITDVLIGGKAAENAVFIAEKEHYYFSRRGPSDHLTYALPENMDIRYFYNEVTVPEGEDKLGSYFMADGFNNGYFGMQVNSPTERRVLFSVWSPYTTDNPGDIPEDKRIVLLSKGEGVYTGEFGNEGSGGQSFLVYDWKPGTTYRFLLKGEPAENNHTDYTAYFYAPEVGQWQLIASFRRPETSAYLTGLYSFLENFDPNTGFMGRKAHYGNQWIYDTEEQWHELTEAHFSVDATGDAGRRLDYKGGTTQDNLFMLQNCGFFTGNTAENTVFTRTANGLAPSIDFSTLERP